MKYGRGKKRVFWGSLFLLGAVAMIADRFGWMKGIGFWSVLWCICLVSGILKRKYARALFSLAFLIIANDEWLHLEALTPWPVLGAALFGSIGLGILFPRWPGYFNINKGSWLGTELERGRYTCTCRFGQVVRYLAEEISQVRAECRYGHLQLYFMDAEPIDGRLELYLETAFGSLEIYLPSGWKVSMDVENFFGDMETSGKSTPNGEVVVTIKGEVFFGSLRIQYV